PPPAPPPLPYTTLFRSKLAFTVVRPTDRPQIITYAISTMIVCLMCPTMSLIATLLFKEPSFGMWVHTWGCNMPMALIWQLLFCRSEEHTSELQSRFDLV